jgi:uncharacterized protein YciI
LLVSWFVLEQRYLDQDRRAANRDAHLAYLGALAADHRLVAAGPWVAGGGSLIVYDVEDEAAARELWAADPYTTGGVTELLSVRAWNPVVQRGS